MISDYSGVLSKNPNYLSTSAYLDGLRNMGVDIFSSTGFIISLTPNNPSVILDVYSTWNKIMNLTIPYIVMIVGILVPHSLYYYMVIPNSIYEIFIGYAPEPQYATETLSQQAVPPPPVATPIAIETHEANIPWEEDGNYYYHDGQGNYYQADPTGTQWINIPPKV